VEKGLQLLNASGLLGYILPHKFFNAQYGEPLRNVIAAGKHLEQVIHFGDQQVVTGVTTYTGLLFLSKSASEACDVTKVADLAQWQIEGSSGTIGLVKAETITAAEWNFNVGQGAGLFEKLCAMPVKLGDVADIFVGLQTSADRVYVVATDTEIEEEITKPFLLTGHLKAYCPPAQSARLLFPYQLSNGKASGRSMVA
jgi:hypothetical protein